MELDPSVNTRDVLPENDEIFFEPNCPANDGCGDFCVLEGGFGLFDCGSCKCPPNTKVVRRESKDLS